MQDTVRGQDRQGPLCIGTRWVIRNEAYSLPVMPFQSDICKAGPQREDTFFTSLPGRKQQLPRASPHGARMAAGMSSSGCKNLDVQGCKSLAPPATALQILAARLAPYQALWHSGKLFGSNLSHISSQQAASLRRQPALFLISFNGFSLKFLCWDQRLWLDSPHILQ